MLDNSLLERLKEPLSAIKPMKAVFDQEYVKRINGPNVKTAGSKMDKAEMLMEDIRQFRESSGAARLAMIWCGSTEVHHKAAEVHQTLKDFECGLMKSDPEISPSQIYAYAALKSGVPYANGAPHLTVDTPAMQELARYWATDYDLRRFEARLNALPQFLTEIDGLDIHFIHVRSKHDDALPLIVTHGWPGSVIEQLKIIEPLTNPTAHGGSASDAFHLVIPSLPGYGFSAKPTTPGWAPARIARAWDTLMKRLGYERYVSQGGDWGAFISEVLQRQAPQGLLGIHINFLFTRPPEIGRALALGEPAPAGEESAAPATMVFQVRRQAMEDGEAPPPAPVIRVARAPTFWSQGNPLRATTDDNEARRRDTTTQIESKLAQLKTETLRLRMAQADTGIEIGSLRAGMANSEIGLDTLRSTTSDIRLQIGRIEAASDVTASIGKSHRHHSHRKSMAQR